MKTKFENNQNSNSNSQKGIKVEQKNVPKIDDILPNKKVELDQAKLEDKSPKEIVHENADKSKEILIKEANLIKDNQDNIIIDSTKIISEKKEENKILITEEQKNKAEQKEISSTKQEKLEPTISKTKFHINEKKFYGEKSISSASSKGSVFQENVNHFFGGKQSKDMTQITEIPKINTDDNFIKPKSLLQKMKQPNLNNDPKFEINNEKFFNSVEIFEKPKMTYAQKMDKFVTKI